MDLCKLFELNSNSLVHITYRLPLVSDKAWIAVVTSGITVMILFERINRQYRIHLGLQWNLQEWFFLTTVVAINIFVWRAVL